MAPKNDYVSHKVGNRGYNPFAPLMNYNIECWKCKHYGHVAKFCESSTIASSRIVCYKCNIYGDIARVFQSNFKRSEKENSHVNHE